MKIRYLVLGTLAAGITLFLWGAISHMAIPWEDLALRGFKDDRALVEAIKVQTPSNGMYFAPQGVFVAVSLTPDLANKTQSLGPSLIRQLFIEFAVGFVLSLILLWTPVRTAIGAASLFGLMGIAAGIEQLLPQWNWYGFSGIFTTLEFFDLVIGWALAGLVLGFLRKRINPRFKYDEQILMQGAGHRRSA